MWGNTDGRRGDACVAPTSHSIGAIIGSFKSAASKRINILRDTPGVLFWQRNYYEHIIRDEEEFIRIRDYIAQNPANWSEDEENPARLISVPHSSRSLGNPANPLLSF